MRGQTPTGGGDGSALVPLLILALLGVGLYLFFRKSARQRRALFFVQHAALFVYLGRDARAVGRAILKPWKLRQARRETVTDEDIQKLLTEPGLPEPPSAQKAAGHGREMPCVICGKMIPNGGLYCDEHRD